MKHTLLVAALIVSPAAFAEERDASCALYNQLMAAAPEGLAAFKGEPVPGMPGAFLSTLTPKGIDRCIIATGSETSMICYSSRPMTKNGANVLYMGEMLRMVRCLKGWEGKPPRNIEMAPPPGHPGFELEQGVQLVRRTDDIDISFGVVDARERKPEPAAHVLGFGFHWKPAPLGF